MRPSILSPLFNEIASLKGAGSTLVKFLAKLAGGNHLFHLIRHLPSGVNCRQHIKSLHQAKMGDLITCQVKVLEHQKGKGRSPYQVICEVEEELLWLVFFNPRPQYLQIHLPMGATIMVSGKIELFQSRYQMTHPDHFGPLSNLHEWVGYEPIYPLTQALSQKVLRRIMQQALSQVPNLPEWLLERTLKWHAWPSWKECMLEVHNPQRESDLLPTRPAKERLAYDELLADQLALKLVRRAHKTQAGRSLIATHRLIEDAFRIFPFPLTRDQDRAFQEIKEDLAQSGRMNRLLQGDVGSGKTIVAFLTLLIAIENGKQGAFMAPTEILARQHYLTLLPWMNALGLRLELLTGKDRVSHRTRIYKECRLGEIDLLIGTHALIQDDLHFKDLAVIVIDEQHRFGVDQRLKLLEKGSMVDLLSMTATPIPRTLMLAAYGDVNCSYLHQKPAGRQEVQTHVTPLSRLHEVIDGLKRVINNGDKIYWVCPLVEESEALDIAAAEQQFIKLQLHFPGQIGLIHGRLKAIEKERIMQQFKEGVIKILVATTVIEVGVDVSDATIMVIEHAERFGLSQLHQLRGRIGRGEKQGICLLLYGNSKLSETAKTRLRIMRASNDGFHLAEEDWKLRGGGDVLGLRQSGMPTYTFASLMNHQGLLKEAAHEADECLRMDPYLQSDRGQALRILLYLFGKDEMIRYLRA